MLWRSCSKPQTVVRRQALQSLKTVVGCSLFLLNDIAMVNFMFFKAIMSCFEKFPISISKVCTCGLKVPVKVSKNHMHQLQSKETPLHWYLCELWEFFGIVFRQMLQEKTWWDFIWFVSCFFPKHFFPQSWHGKSENSVLQEI